MGRVNKEPRLFETLRDHRDKISGPITGGSSRGFRTWGSFRPCILRRVRVSPGPFGPGFPG